MEKASQKPNRLLILGAGQFGQMVKEIAQSMGCFEKIDFLDDGGAPALTIGRLSDCERYADSYAHAIVAMGNPVLRLTWLNRLAVLGFSVATLISPAAFVAPSAQVAQGCIVEPMATVQSHTVLQRGVIVSSGAVIRHNATVGECCHCDCNSVVLSGASVPMQTKVLCGEIYRSDG